jgi:hypothetical protein
MVAFEFSSGSANGPKEWLVLVRDLRSGHVIRRLPTGILKTPGDVGGGRTTEIVVKSDGAVAWIVEAEAAEPKEYEVRAVDKGGSRVLARGRDVGPGSLALGGSTLYWTQGGRPSSTTLN